MSACKSGSILLRFDVDTAWCLLCDGPAAGSSMSGDYDNQHCNLCYTQCWKLITYYAEITVQRLYCLCTGWLWKLQFFTEGFFFGNTRILITNGQRTHQTLILLITMSGELCLNAKRYFNPSQIPLTSWRMSCKQCVMICHRTPSTRPYWALSKDFELLWKLGVDTLNTSWNKLFLRGFELLASCDSLKCQISIWFHYKHYDENCNFYNNCFTW